jgi:folate-binding protein YgfZ
MKEKADFFCPLKKRAIIEVQGSEREAFLQGIITQDVKRLKEESILYSLMLSPQGKFQFDFFLLQIGDTWLIDIDASCAQRFMQRLQLFKLRSDVMITLSTEWQVGVSSTKIDQSTCFIDPRLEALGYRFYGKNVAAQTSCDGYELLRLSLGVPDGAHDMVVDKSIPLEWRMDELQAISWNKGCYMGQELTARSRYVGQIRKRVFPVIFKVPGKYEVGDKLFADGQEIGELRAIRNNFGLALLKLEFLHSQILVRDAAIEVHQPDWMVIS